MNILIMMLILSYLLFSSQWLLHMLPMSDVCVTHILIRCSYIYCDSHLDSFSCQLLTHPFHAPSHSSVTHFPQSFISYPVTHSSPSYSCILAIYPSPCQLLTFQPVTLPTYSPPSQLLSPVTHFTLPVTYLPLPVTYLPSQPLTSLPSPPQPWPVSAVPRSWYES